MISVLATILDTLIIDVGTAYPFEYNFQVEICNKKVP